MACHIKSKDLNMPKTNLITRIDPALKDQLGNIAKAQHRTTSNLVEWLITQYLDQVAKRTSPPPQELDFASPDDLHSVISQHPLPLQTR